MESSMGSSKGIWMDSLKGLRRDLDELLEEDLDGDLL
jgi:hypothetical protein